MFVIYIFYKRFLCYFMCFWFLHGAIKTNQIIKCQIKNIEIKISKQFFVCTFCGFSDSSLIYFIYLFIYHPIWSHFMLPVFGRARCHQFLHGFFHITRMKCLRCLPRSPTVWSCGCAFPVKPPGGGEPRVLTH